MGQSERKRQEQAIRRKDIIDAAERVFSAKGFARATMDEVAREAEFSKRTVYIYFSSKEQLHVEVMIRGYRLLINMVESELKTKSPPNAIKQLRTIFFIFMTFSREHPQYFTAIMDYETRDLTGDATVRNESLDECYRLGEVMFGYLCDAVHKGVEQGMLPSEIDARQTALTLWACAIGIANTAKNKGEYLRHYHGVEPEEFTAESFELIMRLLTSNSAELAEKHRTEQVRKQPGEPADLYARTSLKSSRQPTQPRSS